MDSTGAEVDGVEVTVKAIGKVISPFKKLEEMPIQPKGAADVEGVVEIAPRYAEGLKDLEGFSHLYLIYLFHRAERTELSVVPFMDTVERGVYATRSPLRPNHIGLSVVELVRVEGRRVIIRGVDLLDQTPVLDIKPYIARFDEVKESRSGWMRADAAAVAEKRSDSRFVD